MMRPALFPLAVVLVASGCAVESTGAIALDDTAAVTAGAEVVIPVLMNDRPPLGESLAVGSVGGGSGELTIMEGEVRYRPAPDFIGTDRFEYTAVSESGSESSATVSVAVTGGTTTTVTTTTTTPDRDETPPTIDAFRVEPTLASEETPVAVAVAASDAESGIAVIGVEVGDAPVLECDTSPCGGEVGPFGEGVLTVAAQAVDGAGNATTATAQVIVDGTAPAITWIESAPEAPQAARAFTLAAAAEDANGLSDIEIAIDEFDERCTASPCRLADVSLPAGTYDIEVTATDAVGNVATADETITVADPRPDLVVESFKLTEPATVFAKDEFFFAYEAPAVIVIANAGNGPSGPFGYAVRDVAAGPIEVKGEAAPMVDGIAAGDTATIEVTLTADRPDGPAELRVDADSCPDRPSDLPTCDVEEADETNNTSASAFVDFLPVPFPSKPTNRTHLSGGGVTDIRVELDGTRSIERDGGELAYEWTVTWDDREPIVLSDEAADVVEFTGPGCGSGPFITTFTFTLAVTDDEGNRAVDSVPIDHEISCDS